MHITEWGGPLTTTHTRARPGRASEFPAFRITPSIAFPLRPGGRLGGGIGRDFGPPVAISYASVNAEFNIGAIESARPVTNKGLRRRPAGVRY